MLTSFGVFLNLRPDESEGPLPGSGDGIAYREAGSQVLPLLNPSGVQGCSPLSLEVYALLSKTFNTPFQANTRSQSETPNCFSDAPMLCQSTASKLGLLSCISSTLSSHIKAHSISRCKARNCEEGKMWSRMFWCAQFAFRFNIIFLRSIITAFQTFLSEVFRRIFKIINQPMECTMQTVPDVFYRLIFFTIFSCDY